METIEIVCGRPLASVSPIIMPGAVSTTGMPCEGVLNRDGWLPKRFKRLFNRQGAL
jgi:hypothetical protein